MIPGQTPKQFKIPSIKTLSLGRALIIIALIILLAPILIILLIAFITYYIYKKIRHEPIINFEKMFGVKDPNQERGVKNDKKPKEKKEVKSEENVQDVSFNKK